MSLLLQIEVHKRNKGGLGYDGRGPLSFVKNKHPEFLLGRRRLIIFSFLFPIQVALERLVIHV